MKRIQTLIAAFMIVFVGAFVVLPATTANAAGALDSACSQNNVNKDNAVCARNGSQTTGNFVGTLVNTLLFIVGALAVVMIIVGGILYAISQGNSSSVTQAKNTLLYSVIGLVVAILAYAIVNWVLHLFK